MYTDYDTLRAVLNHLHDVLGYTWDKMSVLFNGVSKATLHSTANGHEPAGDDLRKKLFLLPKGQKAKVFKRIDSMSDKELALAFKNRREL